MSVAELVVYTSADCHPCKAAKARLDGDGTPYRAVDISEDADALAQLKVTLGTPTVQTPLFLWKGEHHSIAELPRIRREAIAECESEAL